MWWCVLVIPALRRLTQEGDESEASWAIQGDPVSKLNRQTNTCTKKNQINDSAKKYDNPQVEPRLGITLGYYRGCATVALVLWGLWLRAQKPCR